MNRFLRIAIFVRAIWGVGAKLNFLFIIVDDLRPALGCYGDENAHTPNIDFLAKDSIVFTQAFAQQSLCAPSRNSFLTGRRPDTLRLYDFNNYWRRKVGNFTTLPQHLKNNGYKTMSIGKIFHPGPSSNGSDDSPYSWTEKPFHPFTERFKNAPICKGSRNLICPVDVSSMPNKTLPDIESKNEAKKFLQNHRDDKTPFFLAVGFQKPHIPLKFPERYLKFHPIGKFTIKNYEWPGNVSDVSYNPWNDLRKRDDVKALHLKFPWEKIPGDFGLRIIQSYYAATTFIDDLIGELLNEINSSSLKENTAVILASDHGWALGEHAEWAKYSNFDVALRVPLIVSIPGQKQKTCSTARLNNQRNKVLVHSIVELVDIFPTVADLIKSPIEECPSGAESRHRVLCSEGSSLLPLIEAKRLCENGAWEKMAFSQYPRPGVSPTRIPNSDEPRLEEINIMGYTVRTDKFRYIAWVRFYPNSMKSNWKQVFAEELYDISFDPEERRNVADYPEYSGEKLKLKSVLRNQFENKEK